MQLNIKHFVIFFTLLCFSCNNQNTKITEITGRQLLINDTLKAADSIDEYLIPYKQQINKVLNQPITYNPKTISKYEGEFNTAIGNLIADIVYEQSNPVFNKRTGKNIDFVLLNNGGIRSIISEGEVTIRTAYEVMPFENKIVVVELSGNKILEMIQHLQKPGKAQPVSRNVEIALNKNLTLNKLLINGKTVDKNKNYFVATSDYLSNGGDGMLFFKEPISTTNLDYLIRNQLIDYFKKVDTIRATIDNRFIKL
ncbi:5'-nucleotidase C-terminal domain-containing protein [Zhouia amylolytica]|uniref:5'-nucleotidase C-terminal domain-containing protein n=1 Tax=Zhouia amylolytica TaxID=376730 RepID=UPI0020CCE8AD|nr:5'-nucleotidase [Zhouia amylolytica]MCQ0110840.1 5'-nucleotidase C-terminal domain-containing protein [Zhouia amylolytica]